MQQVRGVYPALNSPIRVIVSTRSGSNSEPALMHRPRRQLGSIRDIGLLQQLADVKFDRVRTQVKPVGNLTIARPVDHELQYLTLSIAQVGRRNSGGFLHLCGVP